MSHAYRVRSWEGEPDPVARWARGRWPEVGYVLDIDQVVASADLSRGLLVEWKHCRAQAKPWYVTRALARRLGWWAGLFDYATTDGPQDVGLHGDITEIVFELVSPGGRHYGPSVLDEPTFDAWIGANFGKRAAA